MIRIRHISVCKDDGGPTRIRIRHRQNLINYEDGSYGFWGVPIPTGAMTSMLSLRDLYRRAAIPLGIRFGTGVHHV